MIVKQWIAPRNVCIVRESENLLLGNGRHELLQVERLEIRHVLELLIRQQLASRNQH